MNQPDLPTYVIEAIEEYGNEKGIRRRSRVVVAKVHEKKREKIYARHDVYRAVRRKDLAKPTNCSKCGETRHSGKLHGHHEDYRKSLEVVWLCSRCHGLAHRHTKGPLHCRKLIFRVTEQEYAEIAQLATANGLTISQFARSVLL